MTQTWSSRNPRPKRRYKLKCRITREQFNNLNWKMARLIFEKYFITSIWKESSSYTYHSKLFYSAEVKVNQQSGHSLTVTVLIVLFIHLIHFLNTREWIIHFSIEFIPATTIEKQMFCTRVPFIHWILIIPRNFCDIQRFKAWVFYLFSHQIINIFK